MLLVREKRKRRKQSKNMIKVFSALCVFRGPLFFLLYQRHWPLCSFKHPVSALWARLLLPEIVPDNITAGVSA
jgi:hypothetical protein